MERTSKTIIAILFGIAAVLLQSRAGTVITTNLPSNTAIVNIDGRADGAATYNGDQSLWYHPFNSGTTLPQITVPPGTYSFWAINPTDAAARFPALTSAQTNLIYTAWSYNYPWILDYLVYDSSAVTNFSIPQLFDGAQDIGYGSAIAAYTNSFSRGTFNQLHIAPPGRTGTNIVISYTFTNTTTLVFVVPDYALSDNSGGVSVLVFPSPILSLGVNGGSVAVRWPTNNSAGFTLSQATNLALGGWTDVGQAPVTAGSNFSVTLPFDSNANHFFRLHSP
jgi:hypothetical protein